MTRFESYTTRLDVPPGEWPAVGEVIVNPDRSYAGHYCMCGCGDFINLPIAGQKGAWAATFTDAGVTLSPSLLNHNCKAHYFLEAGKVRWC